MSDVWRAVLVGWSALAVVGCSEKDTVRRVECVDTDADGRCAVEDLCSGDDISGDSDRDGVCDDRDRCPGAPDGPDADADQVPDGCDVCPGTPDTDVAGEDGCGRGDTDDPSDVEILTWDESSEVDILWVIDNSGSMAAEQAKLAENFPTFMEFFLGSGRDYHIGVTSTDTTGSGLNGRLRAVDTYRFITPEVQDPVAVFGQMARLGAAGSADETASLAAYRALEMPTQIQQSANEGFYREDASLHVIVVTDEPDSSYGFGSGWNFTVAEFIHWMNTQKADPNIPISFSAIAGPVPGGCSGSPGDPSSGADAGTPYHTIVRNVGKMDGEERAPGQFFSVCEDDWTELLEDLGAMAAFGRRQLARTSASEVSSVEIQPPNGEAYTALRIAGEGPRSFLSTRCASREDPCVGWQPDEGEEALVLWGHLPEVGSTLIVRYDRP